jgi:nucleotide-binding universal stress UspA family protein
MAIVPKVGAMKVLLAVDSSEFSKAAIEEVAARLWPQETVVYVLNVVDVFALTSGERTLRKEQNDAAQDLVANVADQLGSRDIETVRQVVEGHPATSILEQSELLGTDLILVGSHGHGGVGKFLPGSVAREVLRNARCSVGIVRSPSEKRSLEAGRRILLATDGSPYSEAAVRSIAERPWQDGTEVRIVSIINAVIPATKPWYDAGELMDQARRQMSAECERAVSLAKEVIDAAGLTASVSVHEGIPKWRIMDEALDWPADIIVVGSHGRRGLTRLLLGSVSEAVAMTAHCSVEVIRSRSLLSRGRHD